MSMDLSVWSSCEIELPSALPDSSAWVSYGGEFAYEQEEWQVLVLLGEDEEPDESILQMLPKAKYAYYVTLEPIGSSSEAYLFLEKVTRTLAKVCDGVWVDSNNQAYFHDNGNI